MTRAFFIGVALVILVAVLSLLRSRRLREKYAALWVLVGVTVLVLALVPDLLGALAGLVGVQVPSNLLFALAIILLLGVTLHLSLEISRLEDETRVLAEHIAILNLLVTQGPPAGSSPGTRRDGHSGGQDGAHRDGSEDAPTTGTQTGRTTGPAEGSSSQ